MLSSDWLCTRGAPVLLPLLLRPWWFLRPLGVSYPVAINKLVSMLLSQQDARQFTVLLTKRIVEVIYIKNYRILNAEKRVKPTIDSKANQETDAVQT